MTDRVPPLTYVVGLLPSCVALVLWLALGSRLFLTPAPLFLAAVLFAAWYGGRGTGVAAALIGAACAALFPYPPGLSLSVPGPRGLVVELAILGLGGAVAEIVHLARQAEARARELEGLRLRAMHDDLTGLPNRALLRDRVERAVAAARRSKTTLALLFLDLDGFKSVNDTLGHQAGDMLLKEVAARLTSTLRASDTVARLGGDEFVVLLPGVDMDGARRVADKVRGTLEQSIPGPAEPLCVTSSVGVAIWPDDTDDLETLFALADRAMYEVKRAGRVRPAVEPAGGS